MGTDLEQHPRGFTRKDQTIEWYVQCDLLCGEKWA